MKKSNKITIKDCLDAICHFPVNFRTLKQYTSAQIYNNTGYERYHSMITQDQIIDVLKTNIDLMEMWFLFSQDKRWTPAWFLKKESSGFWRVGYLTQNHEVIYEINFNDSMSACAFLIRMEMEEFRRKK